MRLGSFGWRPVLGARPVLSLNARTSPRRRRRAVPECSRRTGTGVALASRDEYRRAAGGARELVASAAGTARCTPSGSRGRGNVGSRSRCVTPPLAPVDVGLLLRRSPKAIRAAKNQRRRRSQAAGTSPPRHHRRRSQLRAAKASAAASRGPKTAPPQNKHGDAHPQGRPRGRHGHAGGTASTAGPDPALEGTEFDLLPRRHRARRGRRLERPGRRRRQRRRRSSGLVGLPDARARLQDGPLGLLQQVPAAGHDRRERRHGDRRDGNAPRLRRLRAAASHRRAPPRPPRPSPTAQGTR